MSLRIWKQPLALNKNFHLTSLRHKETCNLHRIDTNSFYAVGDHVIENFHRLFSFVIIGVTQVLFHLSGVAAVDVLEQKRQRCNAVKALRRAYTALLERQTTLSGTPAVVKRFRIKFFFSLAKQDLFP